jgi:hypothetical protein
MPRNGAGIYVLPAGNPVVPGTVIQTTWANTTMNDLAAALTGSMALDGQSVPTHNLPLGGFKFTGGAPATASDEYARADQVQHQGFNVVQGAAMAVVNAYTGTMPLGITTFTNGMFAILVVPTPGSNTGPATLQINGGAVNNITDGIGGPLSAGALAPGAIALLGWDGTNWRSVLGGAGSALGYTPVNKAGDTMTGALTVPNPLTITNATLGNGAFIHPKALWVPTVGQVMGGFQVKASDGVNADTFAGYILVAAEGNWAVGDTPANVSFRTTRVGSTGPAVALTIGGTKLTKSERGFYNTVQSYTPAAGASITLDFTGGAAGTLGGQAVYITLAGNLTLTDVIVPAGAMMRIFFFATNLGTVTWPGYVRWPGGTIPNLAAGTLKHAIVTICNNSSWALGNASVY